MLFVRLFGCALDILRCMSSQSAVSSDCEHAPYSLRQASGTSSGMLTPLAWTRRGNCCWSASIWRGTVTWTEYWNGATTIYVNARHKSVHYEAVARDIVACLPGPDCRVVDYGCGDALSAHLVADACAHLFLCESSESTPAAAGGAHCGPAQHRRHFSAAVRAAAARVGRRDRRELRHSISVGVRACALACGLARQVEPARVVSCSPMSSRATSACCVTWRSF